MQSPYKILRIPVDANEVEIRKAYRHLAMRYHPDRNPDDPDAEEKFKQIQWAYETLIRKEDKGFFFAGKRQYEYVYSDDVHPFFSVFQVMMKWYDDKKRSHKQMATKKKILFLCTGNSCRSQMAEAWTNKLKGDQFEAYSAGVEPKQIDPRAIEAMAEAGIDISGQKSKDIYSLGNMEFDYVVTLCDNAKESCPFFPAKTKLMHKGFDDPPKPAEGVNDEEKAMKPYRRVRDEIRRLIDKLPGTLEDEIV